MNKKRYIVVQELDPYSIEGIPEIHRKHHMELGYKPYLMGDGKTKWLTDAQRVYKETRNLRPTPLKKQHSIRLSGAPTRRRKGHKILRFIKRHWLFMCIVAGIVLLILYYLK